jgi:ABC-2 type transport system ATP-binding protein
MLNAIALSKRFNDKVALDAVDLTVVPGEIYCLLGANGAGKTTLISLFLNFLTPSGGEARINGLDVVRHPDETKKYVAYIPEQVMLYGALSGIENLEYFSSLATGQRLPFSRLMELLERAGLSADAAKRRVATYSKGMRQKVGIAIAFAKEAKALLLDEPTSGLDPQAASEFSQLLRGARDAGVAVLMATHDLFHAKQTGTRIGIMKGGRLVAELTSEDITHADLEQLYLAHMRS